MPEIGERRVRTATFVVAASDSMVQDKAMADYVCDGVNDHVEIQAALDALPATGGEVKLLDGTYYIEVALVLDSYQTLSGQGRSVILTTTTANLDIITATGGSGTEKVGILIRDLCVDGNAGGVANDIGIKWTYVDYSKIQNCRILNHGEEGIQLSTSDYNEISGNFLTGMTWDAIYLHTSTYNVVDGNVMVNNVTTGVYMDAASNNNTILGNTISAVSATGIYVLASHYNNFVANICKGHSTYGINFDGSDYNTLSGNTLYNNVQGLHIDNSDNNTVTGNTFALNTADACFITNNSVRNIIAGNVVVANGYGIEIDGADQTSVTGNICIGSTVEFGIAINNADYCTVTGNVVSGNTLDGILLYTTGSVVSGNTCQGNGRHGIYANACFHCIIANNYCTENSQTTTNTSDDINIQSSDYNNIEGNTCRAGALVKKSKYGINIRDAASEKNIVINNDLYNDGFGTAPFNNDGTLTHVEDNNRGITIDQIKMFRFIKNTSGAQRVAGDVVSLKAVAAGNEVTAPTADGERQVYGMVAETINDNAWGLAQVKGKTTVLKATNVGGGNIVIGDFLITENGVRARKAAAATDPIFARALEALAAADGVVDAYIVSPWD